uniref:Uncharacterized protein n=1 Tax=Oryza meridionalis TaxID=40149 RepID=A0A0E0ELN6_9ORYZ
MSPGGGVAGAAKASLTGAREDDGDWGRTPRVPSSSPPLSVVSQPRVAKPPRRATFLLSCAASLPCKHSAAPPRSATVPPPRAMLGRGSLLSHTELPSLLPPPPLSRRRANTPLSPQPYRRVPAASRTTARAAAAAPSSPVSASPFHRCRSFPPEPRRCRRRAFLSSRQPPAPLSPPPLSCAAGRLPTPTTTSSHRSAAASPRLSPAPPPGRRPRPRPPRAGLAGSLSPFACHGCI